MANALKNVFNVIENIFFLIYQLKIKINPLYLHDGWVKKSVYIVWKVISILKLYLEKLMIKF